MGRATEDATGRAGGWSAATEQRLAAVGLLVALVVATVGVAVSAQRVWGAGGLPVVSGRVEVEVAAACTERAPVLARVPTHGRAAAVTSSHSCDATLAAPPTSTTSTTTTTTTTAPPPPVTTTSAPAPPITAAAAPTTTQPPSPPATSTPPPADEAGGPVRDTAAESELRARLSERRAAIGQPDFTSSGPLNDCAARWSYKMAKAGRPDHSSTSSDPSDSCMAYTFQVCSACTATAENVGQTVTASSAWDLWLQSPTHRPNIDKAGAGIVGIGVYRANGYLFLTMVFGYTG